MLPSHSRGKQKTGVCRKTTSPRWDQTFTWEELSMEDLADRSLELAVWDHDRMGHQDFLGGVRLNLGTGGRLAVNLHVISRKTKTVPGSGDSKLILMEQTFSL